MGTHVFARLSGHGLTLIPLNPYRFERTGGGAADPVRLTHWLPDGERAVTVTPRPMPRPGAPQVACAPGTASLDEVGGLQEGPWLDHWRIETALFTLAWPAGLSVVSAKDDSRPPAFELHAEQGAFMFFQGPFSEQKLPPLQRMAGLGGVRGDGGEIVAALHLRVRHPAALVSEHQRHRALGGAGHQLLRGLARIQAPLARHLARAGAHHPDAVGHGGLERVRAARCLQHVPGAKSSTTGVTQVH